MRAFLNLFISSFSRLLSSPSFALMANKSLYDALDHSLHDLHPNRRHAELQSLLSLSLPNSSPPKPSGTARAPANTPSLTPSNSFSDIPLNIIFTDGLSSLSSSPSTPTFNLVGESPDDDFHLPDSLDIDNVPKGVGLGFTGITKHDGTGLFDGVGLLSIRRWSPRSFCEPDFPLPLSESFSHDGGDLRLSDTFLREAEMSFIHDPFHVHSLLAAIPECQSCAELDVEAVETSGVVPQVERTKRHFSASTISSELKRTSVNRGGSRSRSSTWPRGEVPGQTTWPKAPKGLISCFK